MKSSLHPVARHREARGWSQTELALRADVPRTSVSAIEGERLTPSVTAALVLRSRAHRRILSEWPGYDARETGELAIL